MESLHPIYSQLVDAVQLIPVLMFWYWVTMEANTSRKGTEETEEMLRVYINAYIALKYVVALAHKNTKELQKLIAEQEYTTGMKAEYTIIRYPAALVEQNYRFLEATKRFDVDDKEFMELCDDIAKWKG